MIFSKLLDFLEILVQLVLHLSKKATETAFEKEKKDKQAVDQEHDENAKALRPSGAFWKDRAP